MLIDAGPGYLPKSFEVDGEPAKRFKGVLNALWEAAKPKPKPKLPAQRSSELAPNHAATEGEKSKPTNPIPPPKALPPPPPKAAAKAVVDPPEKAAKAKGSAPKETPPVVQQTPEVPQADGEVPEPGTKVTLNEIKSPLGVKVVLDGPGVILESLEIVNRFCPKDVLLKTFAVGRFASTADQVPPNAHIYDVEKATTLVWSSDLSTTMPLVDLVKKKGRVDCFWPFFFNNNMIWLSLVGWLVAG